MHVRRNVLTIESKQVQKWFLAMWLTFWLQPFLPLNTAATDVDFENLLASTWHALSITSHAFVVRVNKRTQSTIRVGRPFRFLGLGAFV